MPESADLKLPVAVPGGTHVVKQRDLEAALQAALGQPHDPDCYKVSGKFVQFDFSQNDWFDLGAALWLITLLHKLKRNQNDLQLVFPEVPLGEKLWSFLLRWRFFEALTACVDDPSNLLLSSQLQHLSRKSEYKEAVGVDERGESTPLHSSKMFEITPFGIAGVGDTRDAALDSFLRQFSNKILLAALSRLCGWSPVEALRFTNEVLSEAVRNSSLHGNGSFSVIAMRSDAKFLTFAIADNGQGIPATLRNAFSETSLRERAEQTDAELIKYFTEPQFVIDSKWIMLSVQKGVTSSAGRKGLGLYYLKSHVLDHGGEMRVRSGKALVDFSEKRERVYDDFPESPGTMLRVQIPLKRSFK